MQTINVNPANLKDHICECGNETFLPGGTLKVLPALMSPSGKDEFLLLPGYVCTSCHKLQPLPKTERSKLKKLFS